MPSSLENSEIEEQETLIEQIQRISGSRAEDYTEDTILGSEINRIRHLFYYLHSEKIRLMISYQSEVYRASVEQVYNNRIVISTPGIEEGGIRRCRLKFEIASELYQFEVPILEMGQDKIIVKMPAFIQSAQRRKNNRIMVDDLFMKFIVLYRPVFGRRGAGQLVETRYPSITAELQKDEPNLYLINRIITDEIVRISPDYHFKFYNAGEDLNKIETLVTEEKKSFYLRDVLRVENYFERQTLYGLINYHTEYQHMLRTQSHEDIVKHFEDLRQSDMRNFLSSYVMSPLMIYDNIIGNLYVHSSLLEKYHISYDQAQQVDLLAQLMNYGMSKSLISRMYFQNAGTRIINISLSGLLFELNDKALFDYMTFHDKLKILLPIRHHVMELHAEITRYYPTAHGYNIGVEFFKAGPDDMKVLENFIHVRGKMSFH